MTTVQECWVSLLTFVVIVYVCIPTSHYSFALIRNKLIIINCLSKSANIFKVLVVSWYVQNDILIWNKVLNTLILFVWSQVLNYLINCRIITFIIDALFIQLFIFQNIRYVTHLLAWRCCIARGFLSYESVYIGTLLIVYIMYN